MNREDMEREILKVTQQGGMARVPQTTVVGSMGEGLTDDECQTEMGYWLQEFCEEHHLRTEEHKDMFGLVEMVFHHA